MPLPTPTELRTRAAESLSRAPGNHRLVLISAGITALIALAVSAVNFLLQQSIDTTGGLGGLGLRSILSTIQSLLTLSMGLLIPFWTLGYTGVTLRLAKGELAENRHLLEGFRQFFPALRLFFLLQLLFVLLGLVCLQLGSMLLSLTPLATKLYETLLPVMLEGGDPASIDPEVLLDAMLPIFLGCLLIFAVVGIPLFYRVRMAQFSLLEDPKAGARRAIFSSIRMTRGNCLALLRLDLHFWWFYLLEALLAAISYGDVLLPLLGIQLDSTVAFFLFYAVALAAQLVLYRYVKNPISVTYAHAYLTLQHPATPPPI